MVAVHACMGTDSSLADGSHLCILICARGGVGDIDPASRGSEFALISNGHHSGSGWF